MDLLKNHVLWIISSQLFLNNLSQGADVMSCPLKISLYLPVLPHLILFFFPNSSIFPHSILTTMRVFFPLWVISHQFLWVILSVPISYLRESEILWKVLHSEKVLQFSTSLLLNVMTAEPSHEGMTLLPGKRGKMKDKHKEDLSCP